MTRAQGPDGELEIRSFGAAGASRTVLLLRTGPVATSDPGPAATTGRDVRVVGIALEAEELEDPPTFGGETPAALTVASLTAIARREGGGQPVGVVAELSTGPVALALAASAPDLVDRLALVCVPAPETGLVADLLAQTIAALAVDTLLVDATGEDGAGAQWYADHLPASRVTLERAPADVGAEGRLALTGVWERVLAHVAPSGGA